MAFGSKIQELNLTRDEMNRFGEALKNESFRALLNEYAAEISNPENKRQYEEEIKQLEEERGMNVQFIHPESHHVLKTSSAHGKTFINICSNQLIDKPSCAAATDTDGKTGYNWSLPYSLTPGRPDRDAKGNTCVIYDVVYHPDAIHMAENNRRFMNLINSTAIRGIEDSFQIKLNRNTKQLQMRYKGIPHPAVIRRPIPAHVEKSSGEEGLSFPYPDQTGPKPDQTGAKPDQTKPNQTELKPDQTGLKPDQTGPKPDQHRCSLSKQPTIPHYTLKYRSVLDLQECSSARPKHIIIIIDLPLLRSAHDVDVHVTERRLVLESQTPSYKLDLLLSYPVDEDKGDAKFNKTNKQLTITLPVVAVKNPEISQIRRDDDDEEKPHEDTERPCETGHTQSNTHDSASVTCAVSELDRSEPQLINLLKETHTTDTGDDVLINPTVIRTEPEESDHFHHTCAPEIQNMETEEDPSDIDTNPQEMSVSDSQIHTSGTPDAHNTSDGEQETEPHTDERPGAFSHEDEQKYPVMSSYEQLKESKRFSEESSAASQHDQSDRSATSVEETGVSSTDPADTSDPLPEILRETDPDDRELIVCDHNICFQNTLCFDLD
ncbi:protein kintoun [Xyrauchen texanus]|uniref:protein kintoun n=1 Tax=Xyrauchen texanus TaxID=154827 RepID=UPI0022424BAF|nr:protein kintoun [Xyrauchen texanus]